MTFGRSQWKITDRLDTNILRGDEMQIIDSIQPTTIQLETDMLTPYYLEKKLKKEMRRNILLLGPPISLLFFLSGILLGVIIERGGI